MVQPITLESVATAFSHWRKSRVSNNEAIPDILRDQATKLLITHKKSHVITALKINHSTLKKWQGNSHEEKLSFVTLNAEFSETPDAQTSPILSTSKPNPPEFQPCTGLNITLRSASGAEMCITGEVTPAQLHSLADAFFEFQGRK